jgi:hypothetical protein
VPVKIATANWKNEPTKIRRWIWGYDEDDISLLEKGCPSGFRSFDQLIEPPVQVKEFRHPSAPAKDPVGCLMYCLLLCDLPVRQIDGKQAVIDHPMKRGMGQTGDAPVCLV